MRCGMPEGAASAVVGGVGSVLLQCSFKCEKRDLRVLCNRSGKVADLSPDTARDHAARDQPRRPRRVVDRGERFDLDVFACSEFYFYHALLPFRLAASQYLSEIVWHRTSPVSSSGILRKKNALAPNTMFGVRTQSARFHPNFNFIRIRLTRSICATGGITSVRHGRSQHTRRSLSIGSPGDLFRKIKYMRFFSALSRLF